jgi:hypothetical protein
MDDCLSVVSEVERLAVAEATGPKMSEMRQGRRPRAVMS